VARMAQGAEGRPGSSTGGEEDSLDSGPARQERRAAQSCALLDTGKRCGRPAGNASYSQRVQRTVAQRKLRLALDPAARHIYICDQHKDMIQTVRCKRVRRDSEDSGEAMDTERPDVDLFQLQMNTLRRYKKHFKVTSRPGLNKALLADSLTRHFRTLPVVEKEALTFFIYMIKTNRSKLDGERGEKPADTD